MLNRREFSKYFVTGGAALLAPSSLWPAGNPTASPQQPANQTFDLLIEGGTVIDPAQNIHALLDRRLAELHQERQGRWQRILELMLGR